MKGYDNKVGPEPPTIKENSEKVNESSGQDNLHVPYLPFSNGNTNKTLYGSEINDEYTWDDSDTKTEDNTNIPIRYFWSAFTGVVFALVNSCFIFCAIPQNHIFLVPKAWHEFMTTAAVGFIGLFSASLILNGEVWMNIKGIKTWKNFILLYLISAFAWILASIGYYHIYCVILDLSPPMPLNIHVCSIFTNIVALSVFWMLIPAEARSDKTFWTRYGYYVLAQVMRYVSIIEYMFVTWLFVYLHEDYQFGIAFILPILREVNAYALQEICYKSAGVKIRQSQ